MKDTFLSALLEGFADQVADKVYDRLQGSSLAPAGAGVHPRLLDVEQAAVYIGRSKSGVYHLIHTEALPVVHSDRRVFIDVRDLDRWIYMNKYGG